MRRIDDWEFPLAIALRRLDAELAAEAVRAVLEDKAGFDPNQPRAHKGRRDGGQWIETGLDCAIDAVDASWDKIEREARARSAATLRFVRRNRATMTRALGLAQVAGGAAEMIGGGGVVAGGAATSATGVGLAAAALGAFMTVNGYDNFQTGWNTLITGESQPTRINTLLRELGMTPEQATLTEIAFADGVAGAARSLDDAARRGLERAALARFSDEPLQVLANGQSLWLSPSIVVRGEAWEAFDAARTGFRRTPPSFPVFDQVNEAGTVAISNKTVDLLSLSYERQPGKALYSTLRGYIDRV